MSNNRMFLENTKTGKKLLIAKYYPSTGWYSVKENLNSDKIDSLFDSNSSNPSQWGDNDWIISYDQII
jgi:hypothetical protein